MDTKLTLKVNQTVIKQAKKYAQKRKTSISRLVENYLQKLTDPKDELTGLKITPLVKSLSGVIKESESPKESYADFLLKKYQ